MNTYPESRCQPSCNDTTVCHDREPCKKAESIELFEGHVTAVAQRNHIKSDTYGRHLANTTELFVLSGDAATRTRIMLMFMSNIAAATVSCNALVCHGLH